MLLHLTCFINLLMYSYLEELSILLITKIPSDGDIICFHKKYQLPLQTANFDTRRVCENLDKLSSCFSSQLSPKRTVATGFNQQRATKDFYDTKILVPDSTSVTLIQYIKIVLNNSFTKQKLCCYHCGEGLFKIHL